jgi:hypothetical protein
MKALRLLALLAAATTIVACAPSVPPPPPNGTGGSAGAGGTAGTGGTGGTAGSGGTGGTGGSGGTAGAGGTGGTGGTAGSGGTGGTGGLGACSNQNDIDALTALLPTNARQIAANCGVVDCGRFVADQTDFTTCVSGCVEEDVAGLSSQCSSCYGDFAWCIGLLCREVCQYNSCVPLCLSCDEDEYAACFEALDACAGRRSVDCDI